MLSLCLENAELKEQMGEATSLLESGEQEEAGLGSSPVPEPRRLQRKNRSSLGDHPAGSSGDGQGMSAERGAVPTKRPALEARCQEDVPKRPCPGALAGEDRSHVSALGTGEQDVEGSGELTACVPSGRRRARSPAGAGRGWAQSCALRWHRAKGSARSCRTNLPPRRPQCGHKLNSWRSTTSCSVS